jgi:hypothetical protein
MQLSALLIVYALVTTLRALCPSRRRVKHVALLAALCAGSFVVWLRRRRRSGGVRTPRQPEGRHLAIAASRVTDRPLAAMPKDPFAKDRCEHG